MTCPSGYGGCSLPKLERIGVSTSVRHCEACVRVWAFSRLGGGFLPVNVVPFAAGRQGRCGAYMDQVEVRVMVQSLGGLVQPSGEEGFGIKAKRGVYIPVYMIRCQSM